MRLRYLSFMIAEHASTRVLDAITTLILIRSLDVTSLGTLVVYQAWVAIFLMAFPVLENVLYREHGKHSSAGTLAREIAIFRKFNLLKFAVAIALTLASASIPIKGIGFERRLAAMALAFALPLAQALYGIYREPLRFELKAGTVVLVNGAQRLFIIAAVWAAGHFYGGAIEQTAAAAILVYLAFGFVWAAVSRHELPQLKPVNVSLSQALPRIGTVLTESVIWLHLSGSILSAVQTLDVYFLSRTQIGLSEIAIYSIALKAANFLQIMALPLTQAFGVYLGRRAGRAPTTGSSGGRFGNLTEKQMAWLALAAFSAMALIMCLVGFEFAQPILGFLTRGKFGTLELGRAEGYFRWMLAGVAISTLCFAHGTYIGSRGNIRGLVLVVLLPWFAFAMLGYGLASEYGAYTTACMNVPVAIFYTLGHLAYFVFGGRKRATQAN